MAKRTASAGWEGTLREGNGRVKLGSGAFEGPYSFTSRFESGTGTNPEELIGAAHAGCFTMALAGRLADAGAQPARARARERGPQAESRVDHREGDARQEREGHVDHRHPPRDARRRARPLGGR